VTRKKGEPVSSDLTWGRQAGAPPARRMTRGMGMRGRGLQRISQKKFALIPSLSLYGPSSGLGAPSSSLW